MAFSCKSGHKALVGNWVQVLPADIPFIQGVTLNSDGSAESIGMATLQYKKWKTEGKQLYLWGKSIGNGATFKFVDTLTIEKLSRDSLIVRNSGDGALRYYKVVDLDAIIRHK